MAKAQTKASERYLLETLDRIAKNSFGYSVLYVNISKLKPKNRHPEFIKIFARMFDSIVGSARGMFFILSNGDFVILAKDLSTSLVDEAIDKLRQGLSADPVIHSNDSREFAAIYDFPAQFQMFYNYIEQMIDRPDGETYESMEIKRPVEAGEIEDIILRLDAIDVAEIVKRQSVLRIKGAGKFEVLLQEFFVAVKDLSLEFDPSLDLVANRWLFMYLSQTLDKKTLAAFFSADLKNWAKQISLNLNLSSVFSREFVDFAKKFLKPEQKVIVEVKLMDVFNNLPLYFEAKDILHRGGHKLLIDEVSPSALKMLNIKRLAPDMLKLFWEPLLEYDLQNDDLKKEIGDIGRENVILAKCSDEKALKWGVSYGITAFQGPFVDNLEVAMIRAKCPAARKCTAQECLKRRRLLLGSARDMCTDKEMLEFLL